MCYRDEIPTGAASFSLQQLHGAAVLLAYRDMLGGQILSCFYPEALGGRVEKSKIHKCFYSVTECTSMETLLLRQMIPLENICYSMQIFLLLNP